MSTDSTEFPAPHKARLLELIPEYEKFIAEKNPHHAPRCKDLTDWRKKTAKELMQELLFEDLVKAGTTEVAAWEMAIRRFYTNHYNNKLLRKESQIATTSAATTATSTSSALDCDTQSRCSTTSKAVNDLLARAIVTFLGDLSAREMFASENEDVVRKKMEELRAEYPTIPAGGLRGKAVKLLWATADQSLWEEKIKALADNTEVNQKEFPGLMYTAIENVCKRNRLGSTLMAFSYAFRDPTHDGIRSGTIYTGYDATTNCIMEETKPIDHEEQANAWLNHADTCLPRKPRISVYKLHRNSEGLPVIPHVDIAEAAPSQVVVLLDEYFTAVWATCSMSSSTPLIPWEDVIESPEEYYDTALYRFPAALKSPEQLKTNLAAIYSIYEYLLSISASQPFRFLSRPGSTSIDNTADDPAHPASDTTTDDERNTPALDIHHPAATVLINTQYPAAGEISVSDSMVQPTTMCASSAGKLRHVNQTASESPSGISNLSPSLSPADTCDSMETALPIASILPPTTASVPLPVSSLSTTDSEAAGSTLQVPVIALSSKLSIRIPALSSLAQASTTTLGSGKKGAPASSRTRSEARQTRGKSSRGVEQQAKIKEPPKKRTKLSDRWTYVPVDDDNTNTKGT